MKLRNKDGKLSVEYIGLIILALAILVILAFFADEMRHKVMEGLSNFVDNVLRRR